ncbi:DUF4430 domain-containing protein [Clostridium sp.]|uniref:DUF4430 domain-containing protein n=1 Tax=Clostridium sp. TaxID=1506 RepID=UPI0034642D84
MKNNNFKVIISSLIVLIIAVGGFLGYKYYNDSKMVKGSKDIVVVVKDSKANYDKTHKHSTDAETLGKALDEMGIIGTKDSQFGRFLETVDGITASEDKQEWWKLTVNGEGSQTGIDDTAIKNGDKVELSLTVGW